MCFFFFFFLKYLDASFFLIYTNFDLLVTIENTDKYTQKNTHTHTQWRNAKSSAPQDPHAGFGPYGGPLCWTTLFSFFNNEVYKNVSLIFGRKLRTSEQHAEAEKKCKIKVETLEKRMENKPVELQWTALESEKSPNKEQKKKTSKKS